MTPHKRWEWGCTWRTWGFGIWIDAEYSPWHCSISFGPFYIQYYNIGDEQ